MSGIPPGASRNTRQRAEVRALLEESDQFRSAQRLYADLRAREVPVGLTTVYRTLQALVDSGEIDSMRLPNGEQLFRRCSTHTQHHHLVCRLCARTVEVTGPSVDEWAHRMAARHGFTDVNHTMEIFGICAACAEG
ncbi:Fur family transcriptional regulator [Micromonospora sp. NPDC050276]|uniref:Fur family transcriptional regulator n=1 Tax=Micromonospora sp. NPDC050276 TaxID=3364278 RepID=UPI00378E8442